MKNKHSKTLFPLTLWLILIFLFSAQTGDDSGEMSSGLLGWLVGWIELDGQTMVGLESCLRTLAHFSLYSILGILTYREVDWHLIKVVDIGIQKGRYSDWYLVIVLCLLYAITDEIHQYFVPGRAMQLYDVVVDTVGASVGSWLWRSKNRLLSYRWKNRCRQTRC